MGLCPGELYRVAREGAKRSPLNLRLDAAACPDAKTGQPDIQGAWCATA